MNFLCISNYNNDLSWTKNYSNEYIVYDRSDIDFYSKGYTCKKSPNIGYNIYDYLRFIIENYEWMPDYTTFCKGNVFPRHVSREKFESLMNKKCFTCIFDYKLHQEGNWNIFTSDGNYAELNNDWYMHDGKPYKYFSSYNDFIKFCFKDPVIPKYITFCPGANYVVPEHHIIKYPLKFYKFLFKIVSHAPQAAESHLVERALYTIWNCNFELAENYNIICDEKI